MDRKQKQIERYLKGAKREKSQEERKAIRRQAAERRSQQQPRGPRRRHGYSDDEEDSEPLRGGRRADHSGEATRPRERGATVEGRVVGLHPGRAIVALEGGESPAPLAPELAERQRSAIAVGDRVLVEERAGSNPLVVEVQERSTFLSRPDATHPDREQLVAANVDVGLIAVAAKEPALRIRLVDRYLVAMARGGVRPVVVVTKCDLLDAEERAEVAEKLAVYDALELVRLCVSSESGEGLEAVRDVCRGRTAVVVGQSGVGKSTLLTALHPELELATGRVRRGDGKGRHTTTTSRLLRAGETDWIDTPGVRSFGLAGLGPGDLAGFFPDFADAALTCRFRDCRHREEPDCGVRAAVERGEVHPERLATYLRMLGSLEET